MIWYLIKHIYIYANFSPYSMIFCVELGQIQAIPFNCFIASYGMEKPLLVVSGHFYAYLLLDILKQKHWVEQKFPSYLLTWLCPFIVPHSHLVLIFSIFLFRTLYFDPLFFRSLSLVIFLGREREGGFIKTER